jgi:hypothetical protein
MTKKKTKKRITPADFTTLKKELKALNGKWMSLLLESVQEDESKPDDVSDLTEKMAYHIFKGNLKNGAVNAYVYKKGKELRRKLECIIEKAVK